MIKFKITVSNPGGSFNNPLLGLDRDEYATREEACEAIYSRLYEEIDGENGCEMVDLPDLSGLDDEAYTDARSRYIEDCRAYIFAEGYATSDGVSVSVEEARPYLVSPSMVGDMGTMEDAEFIAGYLNDHGVMAESVEETPPEGNSGTDGPSESLWGEACNACSIANNWDAKMSGMVTFSEADNGKEYVHAFTDRVGIAHTLRASCHSDDESMSGEKAFWSVSDDASSDGVVRAHGAEEEHEIYLAMDDLADKIREDFPGVELAFDFAGQILIQMEI